MPKTAKRIALLVAAFVLIVFAIFLFNQTMQIVQSARAVNTVFGNGVMWALIFTYCILLTTPLWSGSVCLNASCRQQRLKALNMTDFLPISRNGCRATLGSVDTL